MNAKTEQLILLLWTFSMLIVELAQIEEKIGSFKELVTMCVAITLSGVVYYLIGLAILKITNGLYKLAKRKIHLKGGK